MRVRFGDSVVDLDRRSVERAGSPIHLSPRAFSLLEVLIVERPRALSKKALLERVWPGVVVEEQNVKNAIVEIRAALAADGDAIRTVQRFGYAFAAHVVDESDDVPLYWLQYGTSSFPVRSAVLEIGRDSTCAFRLDVGGVSRRHARIATLNGVARIEDLHSKNGTWIEDRRMEGLVELRDGQRIRLGSTVLVFRTSRPVDSTLTEEC